MPIPTDRGYVVVVEDDAGTQTVMIGSKPNGGNADTVYAMHVSPNAIDIHSDVTMQGSSARRFTRDLAEVYVDDQGTVHIAAIEGLSAVTLPA